MERRAGTLQRSAIKAIGTDDFSAGEVLADGVRLWLTQLPAYACVAFVVHLPLAVIASLAICHAPLASFLRRTMYFPLSSIILPPPFIGIRFCE